MKKTYLIKTVEWLGLGLLGLVVLLLLAFLLLQTGWAKERLAVFDDSEEKQLLLELADYVCRRRM